MNEGEDNKQKNKQKDKLLFFFFPTALSLFALIQFAFLSLALVFFFSGHQKPYLPNNFCVCEAAQPRIKLAHSSCASKSVGMARCDELYLKLYSLLLVVVSLAR